MIELVEDIKVSNYTKFKRYLNNLVGDDITDRIIELCGGDDVVMNASFGMNDESCTAYDGALLRLSIKIAEYAVKLNDILPEDQRVQNSSIYKVALLHHIAKAVMYTKNTNDWEVKNRGILYKFNNNNDISLRCGERSILLAMNSGVKFSDDEFEAMRVIDKINEGDNTVRWYGSTLSMLIRQANEIIALIEKK